MEQNWESLFTIAAKEDSHSDKFIDLCLQYALPLRQLGVPVVFDVHNLEQIWHCEFTESDLNYTGSYKTYPIKKKLGGTRTISAPFPELKEKQQWVLRKILDPLSRYLPSNVHGFVMERSIITNAQPHENKKWLINIDLKDFFGTINRSRVQKLFMQLGYEKEVVDWLTSVCTYSPLHKKTFVLPQGAPTSPMIANLIAIPMDKDLTALAESVGATYTRYADDLTFSGNDDNCPLFIKDIKQTVRKHGFRINKEKTRVRHQGCRMEVTGLTVGNGIHVPKSYRKDVLRELHFAKKYGTEDHLKHIGCDKGFYQQWLLGRIMFVRTVDKEAGDKMLAMFKEINWMI